jgi:electron transport complex protein RnfC
VYIKISITHTHKAGTETSFDPGLIHDKWILTEYSREIEKGIQAIQECTLVDNILLSTKSLSYIKFGNNIKVFGVPDYYPIGWEKLLIKALLNKTLDTKKIPSEEGILVLNVQTVLSIYEAVFFNRKVNSKYITIANMDAKEASIAKVIPGTKISNYIKDPP